MMLNVLIISDRSLISKFSKTASLPFFAWLLDSDLINFNIKSSFTYHSNINLKQHTQCLIPLYLMYFALILSDDLSWEKHNNAISALAYRALGLVCWTFA